VKIQFTVEESSAPTKDVLISEIARLAQCIQTTDTAGDLHPETSQAGHRLRELDGMIDKVAADIGRGGGVR